MNLPDTYKIAELYDEYGDVDYIFYEKAIQLAKAENLGITSDREISMVVINDLDEVVAAAWTSWDGDNYEFDIVVSKKEQGKGIGSALIDEYIDIPYEFLEENPDASMDIHVVSPVMRAALENRGFEIKSKIDNENWKMVKNKDKPKLNKRTKLGL
jgi:GNAT superfamily N-acetyltransferase